MWKYQALQRYPYIENRADTGGSTDRRKTDGETHRRIGQAEANKRFSHP